MGSDTESQLDLLRDAYTALQTKNPSHALLRLAEIHPDGGGFNFTPEYRKKCVRDTDRERVYGYARYTNALKDALIGLPGLPVKLLDTNPPCEF